MRGDPPEPAALPLAGPTSTPHARGSTSDRRVARLADGVYPACAGIHPHHTSLHMTGLSLPRMRGDPPHSLVSSYFLMKSTPHARGSTLVEKLLLPFALVYPACAGIHPRGECPPALSAGLPRMRGDPPLRHRVWHLLLSSTPHARGSTYQPLDCRSLFRVYPACAGIHLVPSYRPLSL